MLHMRSGFGKDATRGGNEVRRARDNGAQPVRDDSPSGGRAVDGVGRGGIGLKWRIVAPPAILRFPAIRAFALNFAREREYAGALRRRGGAANGGGEGEEDAKR